MEGPPFDRIAIVAAMEGEIGFLRRAMEPPDHGKEKVVAGTIGSKSITLLRSGVGPASTARRLAEASHTPQCVLSIGCAGALAPGIGIGDAVIPDRIVDATAQGGPYTASPKLVAIASECCRDLGIPFHLGGTVTTSEVAATVEAKQRLASRHKAIAVDMETAKVAEWAQRIGAPLLTLRTISDGAADRIPPEIGMIVNQKGKLRPAKAIAVFARKPKILSEAIRLKKNLDSSLQNLETIVSALLNRI
jgi:adenosylhomocysteine nucleosidase